MRAFNRALSLLLGAALIAVGLLTVVEVVTAFLGDHPWPVRVDRWAATLRERPFADPAAKAVFLAIAAAGLVLLVAEVRRWPRRTLALGGDGGRSWWLHRRSAERQLGHMLRSGTSATAAKVRLRGSRRRWKLRVAATAAPKARPDIERGSREALARLGGPDGSLVRVRLVTTRRVD